MYIQLIGRMLALPWAAAETMPTEGAVPSPSSAARTFPSPAGGRGAVRGRKGARCDFTAHGPTPGPPPPCGMRSEEHTSELQSLMRISYAVFCLKKKKEEQTHKRT